MLAESHGSPPAAGGAERAIVNIFLAARSGQLILSGLMVAGQRKRVRHPGLHAALLAAFVAESGWVAYRLIRSGGSRDRTAMRTDAFATSVGLLACESLLVGGEGAPWMKNLVIGAAVGASGLENSSDRLMAMTALGGSELWSGVRARGRDAHVAGPAMAVSDVSNLIGMHVTSRIYVSMRRRFADLMDQATARRVEQAKAASAEDERSRQQQRLHRRTIEVLGAIADSTDHEDACRLARQEADRLRHILRTKGQVPSRLETVLFDLCEEARSQSLNVELVTVELTSDIDSAAAVAAQQAVRLALEAALEVGDARRAVIRATNTDTEVGITVRDHGAGFTVGGHTSYEARLARLHELVGPVGGRAEVWSTEGGGVRVTLWLPTRRRSRGEGVDDHAPDGIPYTGVGKLRDGDDNRPTGNGHVQRRLGGGLVGAAKDKVSRTFGVDDIDIGRRRQPRQPGRQQRAAGHDMSGGTGGHAYTMAGSATDVVGRTTPFSGSGPYGQPGPDGLEDDPLRAEQTLQATFLVHRFTGLVTGLAALVGGRPRFRSVGLAAGQVLLPLGESVWLGRRLWNERQWIDGAGSAVDVLTTCATLVLGRLNIASEDRSTWVNWAPWSLGTSAIAGQGMSTQGSAPGRIGAVSAAALSASAALSSNVAEAASNGFGMAWFYVGGHVIARQTRASLSKLLAANEAAIHEGVLLATATERSRQLRFLHDGALQTLETLGSGRLADLGAMRSHANDEARRLRIELDEDNAPIESFNEWLDFLVLEQARFGLDVRVTAGTVVDTRRTVATALRDATTEALTNVRKHSGTSLAFLTVQERSDGIVVIVQDFGTGFDTEARSGFGTVESIARRLAEVGGTSEIRSSPDEGTVVRLWVPA